MAAIATKYPKSYATGGVMSSAQPATDACGDAPEFWVPIWQCGGPLDAPELMPTGRRIASHGHRFYELTSREA